MKRLGLVSVITLLLISCKHTGNVSIPSDVILPDSMAVLLTEVHTLQASLQLGYSKNDSIISAGQAFADLWKKRHITQNDYNRYVTFYTHHPEMLDSVYEKVINNINQQKAELLGKTNH